jgi:alpha-beta hydrolase superfamily lysophospholipase
VLNAPALAPAAPLGPPGAARAPLRLIAPRGSLRSRSLNRLLRGLNRAPLRHDTDLARLRQRYEASRKREEELIECRSEHASELELRLFMEMRKTCVWPRSAQPSRLPCAHFIALALYPSL